MQTLTIRTEQFTSVFITELIKSGVTFEATASSCGNYITINFTGGY